jgi:hypothetical protein
MATGVTKDDIEWARSEADRLVHLHGGRTVLADDKRWALTEALEFLRLKAGSRSEFYVRAVDAAKRVHMARASEIVAAALIGWVDFVNRGIAEAPVEAQARVAAATDLMEQVETLLGDKRVHPAAPVMLAGAALEEMLRSIVDASGAKPKGKPGINVYATALRQAGVLSAQDVKNVSSWAGMRNQAAHGEFTQIEIANARLMAQGVNLFMQKHTP